MADSPYIQDITTATFVADVVDRSHEVPVLVDFWATWCGPCRALGPVLEKLAREYAGGFVLAKVDTDREQALAMQFQIRSIPTVMLFKGGSSVGGFPGALPDGQIRAFLTRHGVHPGGRTETWADDPALRVEELRAAIAADSSRSDLQLRLAVALLESGAHEEARRALETLPSAVYGDPAAQRARALLDLHALVSGPDVHVLVRQGVEAVMAGDAARGMELLLDALREDKREESPARRALVDALQSVTDNALVRDTRRRMAALLF